MVKHYFRTEGDKRGFVGLAVFVFSCFFLLDFAQAQEPPRSGEEIGAQAERTRREFEEKRRLLKESEPKPVEIEIKEQEKEKPPVSAISFVLKGVKITGATIFKPEGLFPLYQAYLNQKVTFADLEKIVEKIKAKYKEEGYLTTVVYIPEQELKEGVVEIVVGEGRMGELNVEGNRWFSRKLIERHVHIKKNEVLNIYRLQRDILRLNQNPDLEVKIFLSPGREPFTSDITLKVEEQFPWHMGFAEDNLGGRLTGRLRSLFSLRSSNFLECGGLLVVSSLFSRRSRGQTLLLSMPLDTHGTYYGITFAHFTMNLGKEYEVYDIEGEAYTLTPYFLKELYLSERLSVDLEAGLKMDSIHKDMPANNPSINDQLRTPYVSFNIEMGDKGARTSFSPRFNFGTEHFLGASSRGHPSASRANTGGFFFKYEHSLQHIQPMPFESYLILRSQLQVSTHSLPSSEQFQLGGMNSIRGYPEGDYLCDTGWNLNLDWTFPMYLLPKSWKLAAEKIPLRHQIEPVFFVDIGTGYIKEISEREERKKFLAGIGGGVRLRFFDKSFLRLEWAKHVGDEPVNGAGPSTFYFSFQIQL